MSKTMTFTAEALRAVLAEAVAMALAGQKANAKPAALAAKTDRSIKNEIAVVKAFKKAGFGSVTPHVDVMTFNRWMAKGFRPIEGSKSIKVKNLRLFHKSQVRGITSEEMRNAAAQNAAAIARHEGQSQPNAG